MYSINRKWQTAMWNVDIEVWMNKTGTLLTHAQGTWNYKMAWAGTTTGLGLRLGFPSFVESFTLSNKLIDEAETIYTVCLTWPNVETANHTAFTQQLKNMFTVIRRCMHLTLSSLSRHCAVLQFSLRFLPYHQNFDSCHYGRRLLKYVFSKFTNYGSV